MIVTTKCPVCLAAIRYPARSASLTDGGLSVRCGCGHEVVLETSARQRAAWASHGAV